MNNFSHISQLEITVARNSAGKTILKDQFFTSPFKIMKPFLRPDGGIQIFQQTASAGIMAGDEQKHNFTIGEGACLELLSQSFEKIFKMDKGEKAVRKITATIQDNGSFIYKPLPCIPFAGSDFENHTIIKLAGKHSKFIYSDCICCGRKAFNEEFDYRSYKNLIEIWQENKLIYRDNTFFEGSDCGTFPEKKDFMKNPIMYGNYSHSGTILFFGYDFKIPDLLEKLNLENKLLYIEENKKKSSKKDSPLISLTITQGNGIAIRVLANSAEEFQNIYENLLQ